MNTSIEKLIKKLESNKIKIICIQGPSSSGKSSLLNKISKLFVNPFKINTDDYFYTQKNSNFINYDSPKNIRWIELFTLLDDIKNRKKFLTIYKYSFTTSKSYGPIIINNPFPEEILIEGVYSFYLFADVLVQKRFFNKIIGFECKVIDNKLNIFVRREKKGYSIANEFSVISIALLICKKLMIKIKVKRDNKERNISKRAIEKQIDYNTWPATINFIYKNLNDFDFIIKHGIFNTSLVENIMNMFRLVKNKPFSLAVSEKKYCCEFCKQENAIY